MLLYFGTPPTQPKRRAWPQMDKRLLHLVVLFSLLLGLQPQTLYAQAAAQPSATQPMLALPPATHTLTMLADPTGGGTTDPPLGVNEYQVNVTVTLQAFPNPGYEFVRWDGNQDCRDGEVTMGSNKTCIAVFNFTGYTITVNLAGTAGGSGTIASNPNGISCPGVCVAAFNANSTVTLTASPNVGSAFMGWSGGCSGTGPCVLSGPQTITATFAPGPQQLFVIKEGSGSGVVTSAPAGINCGNTCSAYFAFGTYVVLTPTASVGSHFVQWSGSEDCADGRVTMTQNLVCIAKFERNIYTLIVTTSGNGSGLVNPPSGAYSYGTVVTLTAQASQGSTFGGWHGHTSCSSNANPIVVTIVSDMICDATFTLNVYTITASAASGGSISPSGSLTATYGSSLSFTITPNSDWGVAKVFVDSFDMGARNSYTFPNINSNHTIHATFSQNTYVITPTAGANGSINPSTPQTVGQGGTLPFSIVPNPGYQIAGVWVNNSLVGAVSIYTFTNVSANGTITASFVPAPPPTYLITATVVGSGTSNPSGVQSVTAGSDRTFTFAPTTGHHIMWVWVDGVSHGILSSYTFTNVNANHTISVEFRANTTNTYTITPIAIGDGSVLPATPQVVYEGDSVVFTFIPSNNHTVTEVWKDGSPIGQQPNNRYALNNITASHTISVVFAYYSGVNFTITPIAGPGGHISPNTPQIVPSGGGITFTVVPDLGYHIEGIWVNGGLQMSNIQGSTPVSFTDVSGNIIFSATFAINTYTLTVGTAGPGSGVLSLPPGNYLYSPGTVVTVTATPNLGSTFNGWSGACTHSISVCTFTTITATQTITAYFNKLTYLSMIGKAP